MPRAGWAGLLHAASCGGAAPEPADWTPADPPRPRGCQPTCAGVGGGRGRRAICALLCELLLVDAVPETVLHAALEALLWDVSRVRPAAVMESCVCWRGSAPPRPDARLPAPPTLAWTLPPQIRDPLPADVECACAVLQAVGRVLDGSELGAGALRLGWVAPVGMLGQSCCMPTAAALAALAAAASRPPGIHPHRPRQRVPSHSALLQRPRTS